MAGMQETLVRRVLGIAGIILVMGPGRLDAQPIHAVRLSVSSAGAQANGDSRRLASSRDLRYVLFRSLASSLVEGDTNGVEDLFIRDRDTDGDGLFDEPGAVSTRRVSVGSQDQQADRATEAGAISRDGRFVLFTTEAGTIVPGDTNGVTDVFLRDRDADGDGSFDEPGAVSTMRLSEGTNGVQADAASTAPVMTPDARFVLFSSAASTLSPLPVGGVTQIYRKDRVNGALTLISRSPAGPPADGSSDMPSMSDDGRVISFRSEAGNLGGGTAGERRIYVRDLSADTIIPLVAPPPTGSSFLGHGVSSSPGVAPDGAAVYFSTITMFWYGTATFGQSGGLYEFDLRTRIQRHVADGYHFMFLEDTRYIAILGGSWIQPSCSYYAGVQRFDRVTHTIAPLVQRQVKSVSANPSMQRIVFVAPSPVECVWGNLPPPDPTNYLLDRRYGTPVLLPDSLRPGVMDPDGSEIVFDTTENTLLPLGDDTNAASDIYAVDLDALSDQDADGLDDRWEAATGLRYTSDAGVDGAAGDPDGDGLTNLQELAAHSHPRGSVVRYLAEGAENAFFKTTLTLANSGTAEATAVVRLLGENGATTATFVRVPAGGRRTFELSDAGALPASSFSMVIESDAPLAIQRTMSWTATSGYGAHAERALPSLSTTWFLAEGSTAGEFSLFYLLANPHDTEVVATVRFIRPAGLPSIERVYHLPPTSRTTIHVNTQAQELANTDVSAAVTADRPILVERSMYLSRAGQAFTAGHASAGVTAPAATWYFTEGATGGFFDMFLLLANPGAADANVEARYLLSDGRVFTKSYLVGADSRLTIWVNGEEIVGHGRVLASVDVSTTLNSTNGVPIIAERAMWFPGPSWTPAFWTEAHVSAGETTTAARWVVADVYEGGPADTQTFLLIANFGNDDAQIRVLEMTGSPYPAYVFEGTIPANRRLTLPIRSRLDSFGEYEGDYTAGRRFGVVVESTGSGPAASLVVEHSTYWNAGGVTWAAGTNVTATPVP
jgi:hypothetical protein